MKIDAYYNGTFANRTELSIPLTDRAIFFGDGIYDAAIGRGNKIFMPEEHLNRFFNNAKAMNIPINFTNGNMCKIFDILIKSTNYQVFFLYFQLSRYSAARTHSYPKENKSNLLVTISEIPIPSPDKKLKLILREDKRYKFCNIKTINLLPAVLASREAEDMDADETVFVRDGIITECAHSNIHILKAGKLITHPLDEYILPGIARTHLLSVAKKLDIDIEEHSFGKEELFSADEILVTSSSKLCLRVSQIEDVRLKITDESIGKTLCDKIFSDFLVKTL